MGRNYTAVPHDYIEKLEELTDEEFGRLIRSLLLYSRAGEAFSPAGNERFFVQLVKITEDNFQAAFDETDRKRSESGRKAAKARWGNTDVCERMRDDANACERINRNANNAKNKIKDNIIKDNNNQNNNINSNDNKKETTKEASKKERETKGGVKGGEKPQPSEFDRFWAVYPNKKGKGAARAAFEKAQVKGVHVDTMIQAVEAQKQSRQWKEAGGKYIPHPATWLNQERWDDSIDVEIEEDDDSWNPFLQIAKEEHAKNEQRANGGGSVDNEGGLPFFLSGHG